jgi:hypothetical protein
MEKFNKLNRAEMKNVLGGLRQLPECPSKQCMAGDSCGDKCYCNARTILEFGSCSALPEEVS